MMSAIDKALGDRDPKDIPADEVAGVVAALSALTPTNEAD